MSLIPEKLAKDPYTVFRNRDPARLFTKNFTSDDISGKQRKFRLKSSDF